MHRRQYGVVGLGLLIVGCSGSGSGSGTGGTGGFGGSGGSLSSAGSGGNNPVNLGGSGTGACADVSTQIVPPSAPPTVVSVASSYSAPSGLGSDGSSYLAAYTDGQGQQIRIHALSGIGQLLTPIGYELTTEEYDQFGGPILWVDDRYVTVWQDRRYGNYEIFLTQLDAGGNKLLPDIRVSNAEGFSLYPSICRRNGETTVVWQDDRQSAGEYHVYARRVDMSGAFLDNETDLTNGAPLGSEAPWVACGPAGVGVVWSVGNTAERTVFFQTFTPDLTPLAPAPLALTSGLTNARGQKVAWVDDRYVIAWHDESTTPKAVYAAAVDEGGTVLVPATVLSDPGLMRSRHPALLPAGNRVVVAYEDDRDQNDGYEIYTRLVDKNLTLIGPEVRVTNAPKDSTGTVLTWGPAGDVGILFQDYAGGLEQQTHFTGVVCSTP